MYVFIITVFLHYVRSSSPATSLITFPSCLSLYPSTSDFDKKQNGSNSVHKTIVLLSVNLHALYPLKNITPTQYLLFSD